MNEKQQAQEQVPLSGLYNTTRPSVWVNNTPETPCVLFLQSLYPVCWCSMLQFCGLVVPDGSRASPGTGAAHQGRVFSKLALNQGGVHWGPPLPTPILVG